MLVCACVSRCVCMYVQVNVHGVRAIACGGNHTLAVNQLDQVRPRRARSGERVLVLKWTRGKKRVVRLRHPRGQEVKRERVVRLEQRDKGSKAG